MVRSAIGVHTVSGSNQKIKDKLRVVIAETARHRTGKPAAGDFDGDGKADHAIMDSSGNWNFWMSGSFYTRDSPYYLGMP